MKSFPKAVFTLGVLLAALVLPRAQAEISLVTRAQTPGPDSTTANAVSIAPLLSPQGGSLFFTSEATDIATNQPPFQGFNLFLREAANGPIRLLNPHPTAYTATVPLSASADGKIVLFVSTDPALATNDNNGLADLFVKNTVSGEITPISRRWDGLAMGNGESDDGMISADGQRVVFFSKASDLVPGLPSFVIGYRFLYLFDFATQATSLLSARTNLDGQLFVAGVESASLTPDGKWVAFAGGNTNLLTGSKILPEIYWPYLNIPVYVRNLESGQMLLASTNLSSSTNAHAPALSANGAFLAFKDATNIVRLDLATMDRLTLGPGSSDPVISGDGKSIAYINQQYVQWWNEDLQTNLIVNIARDGTLPAAANRVDDPFLSPDGKTVLFLCDAPNLVTNEFYYGDYYTNGLHRPPYYQLYSRTLPDGPIKLLSQHRDGFGIFSGNLDPYYVASGDASVIALESDDALIAAGDSNHAPDLFLIDGASGIATLASTRQGNAPPMGSANARSRLEGKALSGDGSRLLFFSLASDLVAGVTPRYYTLFQADFPSGQIKTVVRTGDLTNPPSGSNLTNPPATSIHDLNLSQDGRFATFLSPSTNFLSSATSTNYVINYDSNLGDDLFLIDLDSGDLRLITRSYYSSSQTAKSPAGLVSQNRDASLILFESKAIDLVTNSTGGLNQVYLYNRVEGTTSPLVPEITPSYVTSQATISPDGTSAAFISNSKNLTPVPPTYTPCLYVRDLIQKTNCFVPLPRPVGAGDLYFVSTLWSADSQYLLVQGWPRNWSSQPTTLYLYQPASAAFDTITSNAVPGQLTNQPTACISSNGNTIAFLRLLSAADGSASNIAQVILYDRTTGTEQLVSHTYSSPTTPANGPSRNLHLSVDGRYLAFESRASDLLATPTNLATAIFLYDVREKTISMVSHRPGASPQTNAPSADLQMSADGSVIAFASYATLVPDDNNETSDIYLYHRDAGGATDADQDGLLDSWEIQYFGNFGSGPAEDPDHDGQTNAQELVAGTNPNDASSVFRLLGFSMGNDNALRLSCSAVPGWTYQLEGCEVVGSGNWQEVGVAIVASGEAITFSIPSEGKTQRYFRVRVTK